jgi:two-component system sensor histidine kinase DevS
MSGRTGKIAEKDAGIGLNEAIRTLTSELSLEMVLQQVADLSRRLVLATYGALGIVAEDGTLARFVTSGIPKAAAKRIGDPPTGKGVLGLVLREGQALRLSDLGQHPASSGFPPNHPEMHSF